MRRAASLVVLVASCRARDTTALAADAEGRAPRDGAAALVVDAARDDAEALAPPPGDGADPARTARDLPRVATDWCTAGLDGLDEETCYFLPDRARADADAGAPPLLVYLHGIVPPTATSAVKENLMTVIVATSRRAGAAALVPRGVRGLGPAGARDFWGWPTTAGKHAELATVLVRRIVGAKERLEAAAGVRFARTYVAGSSSGAYFLTAHVSRGDLDAHGLRADGLGAISGGAPGAGFAGKRAVPFYVGFGTHDESSRRNARALGRALEQAAWPVKLSEHPFGHGAREAYLDEAFAFWERGVP